MNTSLVTSQSIRETADCIRVSHLCALIIGKMMHAAELGILLTVTHDSFCREEDLLLSPEDYATILGNLLENAIDELRALGAKHIELRPMMLVAGDHAQNDMAGDNADSWKSHLTAAGFDVHCTVEGLGELEDVQRLYVEHLKAELK